MSDPLRVLDTGLMPARWNIAMTAALAELHCAGAIPDTLRFHRHPRSVLLGRHQDLRREVRIERCRSKKIEIARRTTEGPAVFMSPGILAWDLMIDRRIFGPRLNEATQFIGAAVAAALARLGLPARFDFPDEIVIDGRRIGHLAAACNGSSLAMQGRILIGPDPNEMRALVKATAARVEKATASLQVFLGRVAPIEDIEAVLVAQLSNALRRSVLPGILDDEERELAERLFADEIGTDAFVASEFRQPGRISSEREAHPP
jgi:lipoate-protein ligase A